MTNEVPKPAKGLKRVIKATQYSMEGLGSAVVNESAFRSELVLTLAVLPALWFLEIDLAYKVMVVISLGLILVAELLNSAIEAVVDMVAKGYHPLAKRAKDMGSAAVFVSFLIFALSLAVAAWDWWAARGA